MRTTLTPTRPRALAQSGLRQIPVKRPAAVSSQICLLSDATMSMSGYIDTVRENTKDLVRRLALEQPSIQITCGFYRDYDCREPFRFFGGDHPTEGSFADAGDVGELQRFLDDASYTEGNSTLVEALGGGLYYTSQLPWSRAGRIVVAVGDEASHGFAEERSPAGQDTEDSITNCLLGMSHDRIIACLKAARVRCYMVRCGSDAVAEHQYREIAQETGGRFVDFQAVSTPRDLMTVVEAALAHSSGSNVRQLIEEKGRRGTLEAPSVRALLESFSPDS